jgi:hypothetical protein
MMACRVQAESDDPARAAGELVGTHRLEGKYGALITDRFYLTFEK